MENLYHPFEYKNVFFVSEAIIIIIESNYCNKGDGINFAERGRGGWIKYSDKTVHDLLIR